MATWVNTEANVRITIERKGSHVDMDVSAVGSTMHIHASLQLAKWGAKYIPMAATFISNKSANGELKKVAAELGKLVKDIEVGR